MTATLLALLLMQLGGTTMSTWVHQPVGTQTDLHIVRAVDSSVAWAAGENGIVARTADGGITWFANAIYSCATCRVAALAVLRPDVAVVVSGARPARIYLTGDAGRIWKICYESDQTNVRLSAAAFFDQREGFAAGQVEGGRFLLLATQDGGATWSELAAASLPPALPGEQISDASGSAAVAASSTRAFLATSAGTAGRILRTDDRGRSWTAVPVKLATVNAVAFVTSEQGIAVGAVAGKGRANAIRTSDGGRTWSAPFTAGLPGPKEGVSYVPGTAGGTLMAVGPTDSAVSVDGGATWKVMDRSPAHAVSFAGLTNAGWKVGPGGSVQKLLRGVSATGRGAGTHAAPPVSVAPALGRTGPAPTAPPEATPAPLGSRKTSGSSPMSN